MKKLLILFLFIFQCEPAFGQVLSNAELSAIAKTVPIGSLLTRYNSTEIYKADDNKFKMNIYSKRQYENDGSPVIDYNLMTGQITGKGKYVKFIPDDITKTIKMERIISNTEIKEIYTLMDNKVTKPSWTVTANAAIVWDNSDKKLTFYGTDEVYLFETPAPTAWDANGKDIKIDASYSGNILTYIITFRGDEVFPVIIDPTVNYAETDASTGYLLYYIEDVYNTARAAETGNFVDATALNAGQYYRG